MADRNPAVAGLFYPDDKGNLEKLLDKLSKGVKAAPDCEAVVSPHAGYEYSGRTASHAVASLKRIKRFIILGPNHYGRGAPFSIISSDGWQTPLERVLIDSSLAKHLRERCDFLEESPSAHEREHSIEVQLPFLIRRFKRFTFVPISVMNTGYSPQFLKHCEALGKVLASLMEEGVGVIASSDFSHHLPLEEADSKDAEAVRQILKLDPEGFFRTLSKNNASVCGFGPIAVLLYAAKELGLKPRLIHSSSSADATGDSSDVVNYRAIGFSK